MYADILLDAREKAAALLVFPLDAARVTPTPTKCYTSSCRSLFSALLTTAALWLNILLAAATLVNVLAANGLLFDVLQPI